MKNLGNSFYFRVLVFLCVLFTLSFSLFVVSVFAEFYLVPDSISGSNACLDNGRTLYREAVMFTGSTAYVDSNNFPSDDCQTLMFNAIQAEQAKAMYVGGNCECFNNAWSPDCSVIKADICCNISFVASKHSVEESAVKGSVVTGVPQGGEKSACEQYCATVMAALTPNDESSSNLSPTEVHNGVGYISALADPNQPNGNVNVNCLCTKRMGYTPLGENPIPLPSLGSVGNGGGGSGLSEAQMIDSMETALQAKGLYGSALTADSRTAMNDALDRAAGLGYFSPGSSSSSGISQDQMQAVMNTKFPNSSAYTGGDGSGATAYSIDSGSKSSIKSSFVSDVTSAWSSFSNGMKETSIYAAASGFFSAVPNSGGSLDPVVINCGRFGTHIYDMSSIGGYMAYLRPFIMIGFIYLSVRLVVVNKG